MPSNRLMSVAVLAVLTMTLLAIATPASPGEKILYSFAGAPNDGSIPSGDLAFDAAGNLYGTTRGGANHNNGTVFELSPDGGGAWTESVPRRFAGRGVDGSGPQAGVSVDAVGNLFGTTPYDGTNGAGTVFELKLQPGHGWKEKVLYNFNNNGPDGMQPFAGLVLDASGNLYGTTFAGGTAHQGTVFELSRQADGSWTEKLLYTFKDNATDGKAPNGGLVLDTAGNLFGTTVVGGTGRQGTVFELKREAGGLWKEKVLHNFVDNGLDGELPYGQLIFDAAGNLFGTTALGGPSNRGTVFELSPDGSGGWTEEVTYSFNNNGTDGNYPYSGLILDAAGNFYGTTVQGGTANLGTVFKLGPDGSGGWREKVLHSFNNDGVDGQTPNCRLILDAAGNLYGTTTAGGPGNFGTVFEITP